MRVLLFDILLLIAAVWLASEVARLRARVSDLERRARAAPLIAPAVPKDAGTSVNPGDAVVPVTAQPIEEIGAIADRGSRVRGNDGEESSLFDRLVGGRLLIWVGGAALALGGLFLVRYSIEVGLIGPGVRMALAAVLGLAFLAGGELARARMADEPRVAQALVGAGVLVLYAAAYAAHRLYGFYGVGAAFALMALVAAGGLGLNLRHGWPTAALGLVGGLATPALVGEAGAVLPLLAYLLLLNAAVLLAARARGWDALLGAAVLGTAGWTAALAVSSDGGEAIAVGLFALGYALAATAVLARRGPEPRTGLAGWLARAARPAALGLAQLAALAAAQAFAGWVWLLYAALTVAVFWWSRADRLPWLPAGAAAGAVALLWAQLAARAVGEQPGAPDPWIVAAGIALLCAPAAWRARGRPVWTLVLAVVLLGPALGLRRGPTAADLARPEWGLLFVIAALLPAALAWHVGRTEAGRGGRVAALAATAALLAGIAVSDLFTEDWTPAGWALIALLLAGGAARLGNGAAGQVAGATAAIALLGSAGRIGTATGWPDAGQATALLALPGALIAGAALLTRDVQVRRWLWAGAALAGLAWAGVLARQLSGLARVLSFLALGAGLVAAGRVWSRRRAGDREDAPAA